MDIAELVQLAKQHHRQHDLVLLSVLNHLREIDPEVATGAIGVFGDRTRAAEWLVTPVRSIGGIAPIEALAGNRRIDVLRVLDQIAHGIYA